jgi:hypothetical protein
LAVLEAHSYVALIHPGNTSAKCISDPRYRPHDFKGVRHLTGPASLAVSPAPAA